MSHRSLRPSAIAGMIAAIMWIVALLVEYRYALQPAGHNTGTGLYRIDQGVFLLAQLGYLMLLTGLFRARAAGDGVFGKVATGIWWVAVALLVLSQLLGLLGVGGAAVLLPLGGLGQLLGSILTAIAVFRARRWTGWRLLAPAIWAVYTVVLIVGVIASLPLVSMPGPSGSGAVPAEWAEAAWQGAWFVVALALFTEASATRTSGATSR